MTSDTTSEILLLAVIEALDKMGMLDERDLSRALIEIDKKGFTLTPIIAGIDGLATPRLRYKIDDLVIYRILDGIKSLHLTAPGKEYIDKKIATIAGPREFERFSMAMNDVLSSFHA